MKLLVFLFLCVAACSVKCRSAPTTITTEAHVASVMTNLTIMHKCNAFFVTEGDNGIVDESRALVTTASCVFGNDRQYVIAVGDQIIGQDAFYNVEQIYIHPNYSKNPDIYNIAVLLIDKPATGVLVYQLLNSTDYYGITGSFRLWRFVGEKFELTDNSVLYVTEDYYERATNVPLRENELAVMSDTPITNGYYDLGTPFTVEYLSHNVGDLNKDTNYVFGFLGKPRLESEAKFFALYSIPFYYSWISALLTIA